ncbi:MAG: sigma-70 family RNA polymerase sigma factor [Rikenellaceae bacterium]
MKITDNIIAECKKGDRAAWQRLYELCSDDMYRLSLRYSNSHEEAKDILHDGFIKIFSKIGDYRGEGSFEGWMRRIFVTLALDNLRKNKNMDFDAEKQLEKSDSGDYLSILESISEGELISIMANLPTGYQTVLKLYCVEGYSHSEIGKMLRISTETSRSQLMRAKNRLKQLLADENIL